MARKKMTPVVESEENLYDMEVPNVQVDTSVAEPPIPTDITPEEKEDKKDLPDRVVNVSSDNTRVKLKVNHKCTIAKVKYYFEKDKVYNVPANVKRILNEAGLLQPL